MTTYTDYDRLLVHDLDVVILANYFHEHAPFAVKALAAGKHVMSETSCNVTLPNGAPFDVADFRSEALRSSVEDDHWSLFSSHAKPGQPPPSVCGIPEPNPEAVENARKLWKDQ